MEVNVVSSFALSIALTHTFVPTALKGKKNQRQIMRREFEPVGPTLLKNPLDAE
jgi:hypothetical protein